MNAKKGKGEKSMKRKVFAALLACVMTVSLAACGNSSDSSSDKSDAKDSRKRTGMGNNYYS